MRIDPKLQESNARVSRLASEIWLTIARSDTDEYAEILDALARVTGQASSELRKIGLGQGEESEQEIQRRGERAWDEGMEQADPDDPSA